MNQERAAMLSLRLCVGVPRGAWRWLVAVLLLLGGLPAWAGVPQVLWVADVRHVQGQPELTPWLIAVQEAVNRTGDEVAVWVIRHDGDAAWAERLGLRYGVPRETLTPGALAARARTRWGEQHAELGRLLARNTATGTTGAANLSTLARFPRRGPQAQELEEAPLSGQRILTLTYAGEPTVDGALFDLFTLLDNPLLRELPVGVAVPTVMETLPPVVAAIAVARQRLGAFELVTDDGAAHVRTVSALRSALQTYGDQPMVTLSVDPRGIPPQTLQALLPELQRDYVLLTPTQAHRMYEEREPLLGYLQARQQQTGRAERAAPALRVGTPTAEVATVTTGEGVTVAVMISGGAPVASARVVYGTPAGRVCAVDLRQDGPRWTATLPPMLDPGTLTVRARVVDGTGFGEAISVPLTLRVTGTDRDGDGVDDTREFFQGSDPMRGDTDGDGLPDAHDAWPTRPDRDVVSYGLPIVPPADAGFLTEIGRSAVGADGRVIPAGTRVTYRLPAADAPRAPCAVRVTTRGAGTVALNGGAATPLLAAADAVFDTDAPVTPDGAAITVTLTAGGEPLHLYSVALISNPEGPYLLAVELDPPTPPAGAPVAVRALVYAPAGVSSARLRYGATPNTTETLTLTRAANGVHFTGTLPGVTSRLLTYALEAEDAQGTRAQGAWQVAPVGQTRGHSTALVGGREMVGDWHPGDWPYARASMSGAANDHHLFLARPGSYTVWLRAAPRARGVRVSVEKRSALSRETLNMLRETVPAGSPDGWTRLGTFTVPESTRLHVDVTADGAQGYCAYDAVVLTQDARMTPPVGHAGIDWVNSLTLIGLTEEEVLTERRAVTVQATGNLDAVEVTLLELGGARREAKLTPERDGSYLLDPRRIPPGTYTLKITGLRLTTEKRERRRDVLLELTRRFSMEAR